MPLWQLLHSTSLEINIIGRLTLESKSDLAIENVTKFRDRITEEMDVELKWCSGYIPMIDVGIDVTKCPRKIVLEYNPFTLAGFVAGCILQWQVRVTFVLWEELLNAMFE